MKLDLSMVTTHRYFFQVQNQMPLIMYLICLSSFISHHLARQSTFFRSLISYITFLLDAYFPERAISQFHPGYIDWFFLQSIALVSNYLQIHNSSCLFSLSFLPWCPAFTTSNSALIILIFLLCLYEYV